MPGSISGIYEEGFIRLDVEKQTEGGGLEDAWRVWGLIPRRRMRTRAKWSPRKLRPGLGQFRGGDGHKGQTTGW